MTELLKTSKTQTKEEKIQELMMVDYLMRTPLSKLPAIPNNIENEDNNTLGLNILNLIQENKLTIKGMDKEGLLLIDTHF